VPDPVIVSRNPSILKNDKIPKNASTTSMGFRAQSNLLCNLLHVSAATNPRAP
jgi:hypothetical protein